MTNLDKQNYYEILEIKTDASQREITTAYLRLKNAYARNSMASYTILSDDERERILRRIEKAYLVLSSSVKRREYDLQQGVDKKKKQKTATRGAVIRRKGAGRHSGVQRVEDLYDHLRKRGEGWRRVKKKTKVERYKKDAEMERRIAEQKVYTGAFLSEVRRYKNITLEEVAEITKIGINYLRALEEEKFSEFIAPVYIRGFLAQYARVIGLDPVEVCQSYLGRIKELKEVKEAK